MILKRKKITVIINALNLRESMRRNLGFQPSQPPPLTKKKKEIEVSIFVLRCVFMYALTLMTPGQFGPMRRVALWRRSLCLTLTMSCWGMPSVMHTTRGISASMASMMAAAANGGGT